MSKIAIGLLVVLSMSGCWVSTRKEPVRRDLVWVQPGATPVFVALVQDQIKTRSMLSHDHDRDKLSMQGHDETTRVTWMVMIDPTTGAATQLPSTRGFVKPLYWDAVRSVLWAQRGGKTVGFMKSGVTILDDEYAESNYPRLPMPFALTKRDGRTTLYNLRTSGELKVDAPPYWSQVTGQLDGLLLRLSRLWEEGEQLRLDQSVTDWSTQRPFATPTIQMRSPPLDPAMGTRRAYQLSDDGRHLLEVVDLLDERRLIIYDVLGGTPPLILTLPHETLLAPDRARYPSPRFTLEALDLDTFLLVEDTAQCGRGHFFSRASSRLEPTPPELCIQQVETVEATKLRLLHLQGTERFAYRTPAGRIVDLGEGVKDPRAVGSSAIAFSRRAGDHFEVVRLERGTGELRVIGSHPASATLINVTDELIITQVDGRRLATQRIGEPAAPPILVDLPTALGG